MIKSIPIPTAGVSLGLAALGNLLQPYSPLMKYTCGILAAILLAMLLIKILRYPKLVHADMTGWQSYFRQCCCHFFYDYDAAMCLY